MATKRSYEVRFGINDSQVAEQLANIDKSLKDTQSQAKLLKTALSNGWDAGKWVQAKQTAVKAVEDTAKKVELLKQRLQEMEADGSAQTNAEQFRLLQKELLATENAAAKAQEELQKINTLRLDAVKKELQEVDQKLTAIGKTMTLSVTTPIVAGGALAVSAYSDMAESLNKVETAFGGASGGVVEFSNNTLKSYGIAKSTALDMAAGFGDMATSMGFSQASAADMSKTLVGLAGDLASFKNIGLDEAQTALTAIFTGETERLKRLGVVMTEVNLKEYALAAGIKTAYDEMTQAEKVQLRYQYVLANTANSQGDFARTSDSTANQMRILRESLKELAAVAGAELAPMITPIIEKISDVIQSLSEMDDGTKKLITNVAIFAASFGPLLTVSGKLTGGIASLVMAYRSYKASSDAATASQTALNVAQSASPAGALVTVISMLVAALGSYALTSALASDRTESLSDKIEDTVQSYEDAIEAVGKTHTQQQAELAVVERLTDRYEELNGKVGDDKAKKAELASVVEQISDKLGIENALIDEETGKYELSTKVIRDNIQARKDLIAAQAYASKATEAQSAMIELTDSIGEKYGYFDYDAIKARYEKIKNVSVSSPMDWFMGLFQNEEQKANAAGANGDLIKERDELKKYLDEYKALEEQLERYLEKATTGETPQKGTTPQRPHKPLTIPLSDEEKEALKKSEIADIEWYYASEQITQQEYLKRLTAFRDKWLEKDSEEWREYTLKIKKGQDELANGAAKSKQEALEAAEKAQKEAQEAAERAKREEQEAAEQAKKEEQEAAERAQKEAEKAAEEAQRKRDEQRDKELADIEYFYKSGQIAQQEYLKRLTSFRDKWFAVDTEEWRSYTLEIMQLQEELADAERKAQEDRVKAYEEASAAIVSAAEAEADAKIKAIDEELAARNRLKEEQEQEKRLQEAMAELAFTRDADSRASLQQEINALKESIEEQRIVTAAEAEKSRIQAEVDALKAMAAQQLQAVSTALLGTQQTALNTYLPNFTVNVQGLTVEQAADMIQKAFNRILYGG